MTSRFFVVWAGLCASAMFAVGCGEDEPSGPPGATYALSNGVTVAVGADGSIDLSSGERELLRLDGQGPTSRTFERVSNDLFGSWKIDRLGDTPTRFSKFAGSEQDEDGIIVRYQSATGTSAAIRFQSDNADVTIEVTADGDYQSLSVPIACGASSSFFGWGEQYNAADQRGERFDLFVQEQGIGRNGSPDNLSIAGHAHSTYYPMPYFLDARGFGLLLETDYRTLVDLCATDPNVASLETESAAPLRAHLFTGPTTVDVIAGLGDRVGRPTAPPAWAFELWIGSQGGREAVLAEVEALEAAQIDVGVLWVQDWTGKRQNAGGGSGVQYRWVADETYYPDLPGMVDELHDRGYRFLAYANPFVVKTLPDHFDDMDNAGLLIKDDDGNTKLHPAASGEEASHPDLTNPAAREYVKGFLTKMVEEQGFDGWMADFGEWLPIDATLDNGSDAYAYHNRYPEAWHRLTREVFEETRPDGDWVMFSRSGWTGQQSVMQVVWCGDQEATFDRGDGLPTVVPCMLNLGLSGVPFVTHDIAGFSGGPSTKELYLRWIELGAFTPIMRTHEGNEKDKNWSWESDTETTEQLRRFAAVHAALGPELRSLAAEAAMTSMPLVRHLMLEFPDDEQARTVDDQFMLGPDLLVAPVVTQGASSREVYLPAGEWFHLWTGKAYSGPGVETIDAPIGSPPVFSLGRDRADLREL